MTAANSELWIAENLAPRKPIVDPSWPHEVVVKLFSSRSYSEISAGFLNILRANVLDVGCYYGNCIRFFEGRGHRCTGVEATDDMVEEAKKNIERMDLKATVRRGTNRNLPFDDGDFDLVTSLNTIHYDHGEMDVLAALREFKRVTKPGGIVFVETAGDRHMIREGAKRIAPLKWEPNWGDFRNNSPSPYGLFDNLDHFREIVSTVFPRSEFGRILEQYPKRTVDFVFAVCEAS